MAAKSKKSSLNINKHTTKSSITSMRKGSSHGARDLKSSAQLINEDLSTIFQRHCRKLKTQIIPEIVVIPQEPSPGCSLESSFEQSHLDVKNEKHKEKSKNIQHPPKVLVIFDNYEIQTVLNMVIIKHFSVDRSMLIALRKLFQTFDTIVTLKLEYCCLENTTLRTLKTILQKNELITDLSINGNPNRFQNFYILLKGTRLTHISMRFCQINDRGIELIASQLGNFLYQSLLSLNLSSNFISDKGITAIAGFLRSNRRLISLNLSDNWITDIGCEILMSVFKKFALTHEEIVTRRRRIMDFLFKKADLMEIQKLKFMQGLEVRSLTSYNRILSSRDSENKGGKDSASRKSSKGHYPSYSANKKESVTVNSKKSTDLDIQLIEEMVEAQIGLDEHPFVKDSYPEDKEIFCKGNLRLLHLNLAYNKITITGLEQIRDMLVYQKGITTYPQEGLSYIILEGNLFPKVCNEITNINEILEEPHCKRFSIGSRESRRSSKREKSGLSRVSVTN